MIVLNKNDGEKIPYEVSGTKICFDDTLTLNCAKLQKDNPVHKDICMDSDGNLTMGVSDGLYYVAELDIPATEYQETVSEDGEEITQTALALDMNKVTLTLWALNKPTAASVKEV